MRVLSQTLPTLSLILIICLSLAAQREDTYYIKSALGEKYLDVRNGIATAGTPLHIWEFNGTRAQKFKLESAGDGYFFIKSDLGRYVHITDASGTKKSITAIGDKKNGNNFKWQFEPAGKGYYYIISKTGTYLDVQWAVSKNGTPVWMWTKSGTNAQKWQLEPLDDRPPPQVYDILLHPEPPTNSAENQVTVVYSKWQQALTAAFHDLKIHIHNYTTTEKPYLKGDQYKWFKGRDCYFQFEAGADTWRHDFNMIPFRKNPMTIYLNDINLAHTTVSYEDNLIKVHLRLDDFGTEVYTNCINNFDCGAIGNPTFNLINPAIEIRFKPSIDERGRISYRYAKVKLLGIAEHIGSHLAPGQVNKVGQHLNFTHNSQLSRQGEEYLDEFINSGYTKSRISNLIMKNLAKTGQFGFHLPEQITFIKLNENGDLIIH